VRPVWKFCPATIKCTHVRVCRICIQTWLWRWHLCWWSGYLSYEGRNGVILSNFCSVAISFHVQWAYNQTLNPPNAVG
jgi:hypothetical protein